VWRLAPLWRRDFFFGQKGALSGELNIDDDRLQQRAFVAGGIFGPKLKAH